MLSKDELKRYNRNIIIDKVGAEGQLKLLNAKILVCGAGGLGSAVLTSLASVGIGNIGIIDNDTIELSNLNRQFIHKFDKLDELKVNSAKCWINEYNKDIKVDIYPIRLDYSNCDEIINNYDLVIDCFDSFESKFTLNKVCINNGKTLIHGGVSEFFGQVMTIIPNKTPCLCCIFPNYENEIQKAVLKGVVSPAVNAIGSIQAMEAVKVILEFKKLLTSSFLSYDGINMVFKKISVEQNTNCNICGKIVQVTKK